MIPVKMKSNLRGGMWASKKIKKSILKDITASALMRYDQRPPANEDYHSKKLLIYRENNSHFLSETNHIIENITSNKPIEINAYIPGIVKKVYKEEGIRLESSGTYIQGIIGVGGEKQGKLIVIADSPEYIINENEITSNHEGCILVVGSFLTYELYKKAESMGVSGIITGGFDYNSLSKILGYSLGVAITGTEKGMTLIITEGFGQVKMSNKTFNLLLDNNNNNVSINGSTQIRAGVLRPEIFIASKKDGSKSTTSSEEDLMISIRKVRHGIIHSVVLRKY